MEVILSFAMNVLTLKILPPPEFWGVWLCLPVEPSLPQSSQASVSCTKNVPRRHRKAPFSASARVFLLSSCPPRLTPSRDATRQEFTPPSPSRRGGTLYYKCLCSSIEGRSEDAVCPFFHLLRSPFLGSSSLFIYFGLCFCSVLNPPFFLCSRPELTGNRDCNVHSSRRPVRQSCPCCTEEPVRLPVSTWNRSLFSLKLLLLLSVLIPPSITSLSNPPLPAVINSGLRNATLGIFFFCSVSFFSHKCL